MILLPGHFMNCSGCVSTVGEFEWDPTVERTMLASMRNRIDQLSPGDETAPAQPIRRRTCEKKNFSDEKQLPSCQRISRKIRQRSPGSIPLG
jgi:hypothetical protein